MKRVLLTGSEGFIGSFLCDELLNHNYEVIGIDNFSKYGSIEREHRKHKNFTLINGDVKNLEFHLENYAYQYDLKQINFKKFDYIIMLAAKIGGIKYFHKTPYDLFSENEAIMKSSFDFALKQQKSLKRVVVVSSSMVFENCDLFPSPEEAVNQSLPPFSSYGRQKLVTEWWAKAAYEQYKLPYVIVRPFNASGIGEEDYKEGNSHVIPELIWKVLRGQDPLEIYGSGDQIRCFTNVKDIARGIRIAMEHPNALNQDFNISIDKPTKIIELAEMIWKKLRPNEEFNYISIPALKDDVQYRVPDVLKASKLLNFEANISLEQSIDEVVDYIKNKENIKN